MPNSEFKLKDFAPEVILWCLRWYGSTPMSYADLSDMLAERGISVNRSTIYRWFIEYSPALRKKLRHPPFIRMHSLIKKRVGLKYETCLINDLGVFNHYGC